MSLIPPKPNESEFNFATAPEGNHQGVCCDVVDLGIQEEEWNGKVSEKWKCRLIWELNEVDEETGKRFTVSRKFTVSLHENASLRKMLKSWRGKDFTEDELGKFDLETVIGANCLLNVVHNVSGDRTYANVETVTPLPKGMKKIKVSDDYVRVKDRDGYEPPSHEPKSSGDGQKGKAPKQPVPAEKEEAGLPF